jgi:diaminopimelate decarboxylase
MLYNNLNICDGELTFCNVKATTLTNKYGTPLMVLDIDKIRNRMREYLSAVKTYLTPNSTISFASKALCFTGIYKICKEENIGIDTVSAGELYTALKAGFDVKKAYFHGNNKTDSDIEYAIDNNLGYFVADNIEEVEKINEYAKYKGKVQDILLRITPGIDPHTHTAINTGKVDSKFGTPIETGQAIKFVEKVLTYKNVNLVGFHSHIGSQIFESSPFIFAGEIMLKFIKEVFDKFGYMVKILNLGGGFGVKYVETDPEIDYTKRIQELGENLKRIATGLEIKLPDNILEPGRSLVADAGITFYTVGSVKEILGYKNYVSIDGGMTDNPRYALYQSAYTVYNATKIDKKADFICTVAGRCCESGDLIQENVNMPKPERGDIIAVLCTGAYNYAMASNYNKIPRPPIVGIENGADKLLVRRESFEDLTRLDV